MDDRYKIVNEFNVYAGFPCELTHWEGNVIEVEFYFRKEHLGIGTQATSSRVSNWIGLMAINVFLIWDTRHNTFLHPLDPKPGVQRVYQAAKDYMNKEPYDTKE